MRTIIPIMQTPSPTPSSSLDARIESPLLYILPDGTQGFVHDTYMDFFYLKYLANHLNDGTMRACDAISSIGFKYHISGENQKEDLVDRHEPKSLLRALVEILSDEKRTKMFDEISSNYFIVKSHNGYLPYLTFTRGVAIFSLKPTFGISHYLSTIDFVYQTAFELGITSEKLGQRYVQERESLCDFALFGKLGYKAQNYVFGLFTPKQRESIINIILSINYSNKSIDDFSFDSFSFIRKTCIRDGFKFDIESTMYILKKLSEIDELNDKIPSSEKVDLSDKTFYFRMPSARLAKHFENNPLVISALLNYLKQDVPNRLYVANVLINMNLNMVYQRRLLDQLYTSEGALPLWEKLTKNQNSRRIDDLKGLLGFMEWKGNKKTQKKAGRLTRSVRRLERLYARRREEEENKNPFIRYQKELDRREELKIWDRWHPTILPDLTRRK